MQENESSAEGSALRPKLTKYRLACDSCQHSKIRCDRGRPECRRCAKKGIACVYSPARRAGRPRTRDNNKSSSIVETSAPASSKGYLTPITEDGIKNPATDQVSPFVRSCMLSASKNCSSSTSKTSTIPSTAQTFQEPSPYDIGFSLYQQSDNDFLQGLRDFTDLQYGTPVQTTSCYYPMSPDFHITPEFLNIGFGGAQWEQRQKGLEQFPPASTTVHITEELPCSDLLTPDGHHPRHHSDQHQEDTLKAATSSNNIESCSYTIAPQQQVQLQLPHPLDHAHTSIRSCNCVSTLIDHLSTPSHAPSPSSLAFTSAAFATSRMLINCCCSTMTCPNACFTRPSTALVICEAIGQALVLLKLGGASPWTPTLEPISSHENGISPSPLSSLSSTNTGGGSNNDIMLVDEGHEPLHCGTLPIYGADRRALVRVLLVKRVLEAQGVLERLQNALMPGLLVGGDAAVKNQLLAVCAEVVGDFARKVAERVETVKLHM